VAIWLWEWYITYSVVLVVMSVGTVMYTAWEVQKAQIALRRLARSEGVVQKAAFSAESWSSTPVHSAELVPGDLVAVTDGMVCPCDFVLLTGQCILNEAMLTGESAPVIKQPLPLEGKEVFDPQTNRSLKYMLLSGSSVMSAKISAHPPAKTKDSTVSVWDMHTEATPVLAMVIQTGSETAKGKLIQTIQYPQDSRGFAHKQREDASTFMAFLMLLTLIICAWDAYYLITYLDYGMGFLIVALLDLTTYLVPAALPMILSVGVAFAFESLQQKSIFASSSNHIVTAGHVDCICYDKTGTLTTEGDTFVGIYDVATLGKETEFQPFVETANGLEKDSKFRFILAACHSLTSLKQKENSAAELVGEQLELEMFKASSWTFNEVNSQVGSPKTVKGFEVPSFCSSAFFPPTEESTFLAALRIFPFDAELRTMSTVVLALDPTKKQPDQQMLLVKGAPEAMKDKCLPASLPKNFDTVLEDLANDGYRVLGCGYKKLKTPLQQTQQELRASIEKDLTFCGFLIMGNQLKPETKAILNQVQEAGLRQCMVTGDNILTALAVARQCNGVFISKEPTYILDLEKYVHGNQQQILLSDFSLTLLTHKSASTSNKPKPFLSFEELLFSIECGQCEFSIAITGNAFSALMDMHDAIRPEDLSLPRKRNSIMSEKSVSNVLGTHFTPLQLVLSTASVYARCKPHEKQMLMASLQKLAGHYVCMVGDGANDSFALKTADIGLSISSNTQQIADGMEAKEQVSAAPSIAAPFSTPTSNIGPVSDLLCEGRSALASTIIAFRYMIHYGITAVCQLLVLEVCGMMAGDIMWVVGDLVINLPIALFLNTTACASKLRKGLPETSIISTSFFYAFGGHAVLIVLTQILALLYLKQQPWYVHMGSASDNDGEGTTVSMEVTVIFWVQISQYITSAIALSHDYGGFRGKWWTNKLLVVCFSALGMLVFLMIVCNKYEPVRSFFVTVELPQFFCWELVGFIVATCIAHILFESTCKHVANPTTTQLSKYQARKQAQHTIESV